MLFAFYIKNKALSDNSRLLLLRKNLEEAGCVLYDIESRGDLRQGTEAVISVGGDGTFLSASKRVADSGIPIIGVNMGRLGFLSENKPEDVAEALVKGEYRLENRTMLSASISGTDVDGKIDFWPYALNEVTVHRSGAAVLGISVCVDGE